MKTTTQPPRTFLIWPAALPATADVKSKVITYLQSGLKTSVNAMSICLICGIPAEHNQKAIRRLMAVTPEIRTVSIDDAKGVVVYLLNREYVGRAA